MTRINIMLLSQVATLLSVLRARETDVEKKIRVTALREKIGDLYYVNFDLTLNLYRKLAELSEDLHIYCTDGEITISKRLLSKLENFIGKLIKMEEKQNA